MLHLILVSWFSLSIFISAAYTQEDAKAPTGTFYHAYWYERGMEHGNPDFNSRFRVNSPDVVLHLKYQF